MGYVLKHRHATRVAAGAAVSSPTQHASRVARFLGTRPGIAKLRLLRTDKHNGAPLPSVSEPLEAEEPSPSGQMFNQLDSYLDPLKYIHSWTRQPCGLMLLNQWNDEVNLLWRTDVNPALARLRTLEADGTPSEELPLTEAEWTMPLLPDPEFYQKLYPDSDSFLLVHAGAGYDFDSQKHLTRTAELPWTATLEDVLSAIHDLTIKDGARSPALTTGQVAFDSLVAYNYDAPLPAGTTTSSVPCAYRVVTKPMENVECYHV